MKSDLVYLIPVPLIDHLTRFESADNICSVTVVVCNDYTTNRSEIRIYNEIELAIKRFLQQRVNGIININEFFALYLNRFHYIKP